MVFAIQHDAAAFRIDHPLVTAINASEMALLWHFVWRLAFDTGVEKLGIRKEWGRIEGKTEKEDKLGVSL